MHALSFEQAPPPSVPLRFFLTAPLFLLLAGALLLGGAEAVAASRWSAESLALTHLLTAGFMLQVMLGALFQLMPVSAGANLWRPRLLAAAVHVPGIVGALALASGFLWDSPLGYALAVGALGLSLGLFGLAALAALLRSPARGASVVALRLAVSALLLTLVAGAAMAFARAGLGDAGWLGLSPTHVALGLAGWGGVLVAGTAYLVVPMFQLTPAYPGWFSRGYAWAVALAIVVGAFAGRDAAWLPMPALGAGFALLTLDRQRRRRRAKSDVTLRFWRLAMWCVLAACAAIAVQAAGGAGDALPQLAGVLLLFGGFVSVIAGMLYKIVPFILWLHLQPRLANVPPMTRMLSEPLARWHWRVHLGALAAAVAGVAWAPAGRLAGALVMASALLLGWQLLRVVGKARDALRLAQAS